METKIIIINNKQFSITKYIRQSCPFIDKYFTDLWENKGPIMLSHPYLEITETDINQVFSLIELVQVLIKHKTQLTYSDINIDNIVIAAFIIDYFGCHVVIPFLDEYVRIHHNIPPLLLFLYKREFCAQSLEEPDFINLLQWDHKLHEILYHAAPDILLDIHSYAKYITPFDLDINYEKLLPDYEKVLPDYCALPSPVFNITIPNFGPQITLPPASNSC